MSTDIPIVPLSDPSSVAGPATTIPIRVRRRSRKACIPCRQRKRKCDGNEPCAACLGYGYNCRYTDESHHNEHGITKSRLVNHMHKRTTSTSSSPSTVILDYPATNVVVLDDEQPKRNGQQKIAVLDPVKSRFLKANSVINFPRSLGIELDSVDPPRLHSFAWNAGIRPETRVNVELKLRSMITYEEVQRYAKRYFDIIHPIYRFVNKKVFDRKVYAHWHDSPQGLDHEAITAGVVALGSLYSPPEQCMNIELELELVAHNKSILESTSIFRNATIEHIIAFILRSIFLRTTHRPHASWIASCTTLHIVESIGLHQATDTHLLEIVSPSTAPQFTEEEQEMRRRVFWMAWSLNRTLSYEYGRSPVFMSSISCRSPTPFGPEDYMCSFINLAKMLPADEDIRELCRKRMFYVLDELANIHGDFSELMLLKADMAFCIYRRLRIQDQGYPKEALSQIVTHGKAAMKHAQLLADAYVPWWNVISTPFQFVCVLLAIDSMESLSLVPMAHETLKAVVHKFESHMAKEALQTAEKLIALSRQKKVKQLEFLILYEDESTDQVESPSSDKETVHDDIDMMEGYANAIDWDDFLNPTYVFSS